MGCFNVACGISGVTIVEGERMGALLIRKKKGYSSANHTDTNKSDQYFMTSDLYVPITPPVYGEYDDYGGLSNIENSPVVNYLKEDFGMPVEVLFECIDAQSPFRLSDESLSFFYDSDDGSSQYVLDKKRVALANIDFSMLGWSWSDEYYEWIFKDKSWRRFFALSVPDDDNCIYFRVWMDGREDYAKTKKCLARDLQGFIEWFSSISGVWLGMDDVRSRSFEMTRGLTWMPFVPEIFETLKSVVESDFMFDLSVKRFDDMVDALPEKLASVKYDSDMVVFANDFMLQDTIGLIEANAYRSIVSCPAEWRDLAYFAGVMRSVNRIYSPTNTIKQGADYGAELAIGRFLLNRAEKKMKEIDEY